MFKAGEIAVYPAHGVGVVERIEKMDISGSGAQRLFYVLRLMDNDMTIMIPQDNAVSVGMRSLIAPKEVPKILKLLKEKKKAKDKSPDQTWNRRQREYTDKIKTGSIYEIAAVLRELYLLKLDKDLSFGEKKVLDTARNLLIKELSLVQKTSEALVEKQLDKIFNA
jgi:CarD family transcriptional regulator